MVTTRIDQFNSFARLAMLGFWLVLSVVRSPAQPRPLDLVDAHPAVSAAAAALSRATSPKVSTDEISIEQLAITRIRKQVTGPDYEGCRAVSAE